MVWRLNHDNKVLVIRPFLYVGCSFRVCEVAAAPYITLSQEITKMGKVRDEGHIIDWTLG